jgi:hypothetical protein
MQGRRDKGQIQSRQKAITYRKNRKEEIVKTSGDRMSSTAIRTTHLSKQFGAVRAIDQLTLEIPQGIIFGFLGLSGSGKTTTIRLLLGLIEPTTGSAQVLGYDTRTDAAAIRQRSGGQWRDGVQAPVLNAGLPDGTYPARRDVVESCGRSNQLSPESVASARCLGGIKLQTSFPAGRVRLYAVSLAGIAETLVGPLLVRHRDGGDAE